MWGRVGDKHRLEIVRKRLRLFTVTLSPASTSGSDRRNVRSGAVELLRGLPQGIIPRGEGGKIPLKGIVIDSA
jgi:hypothetical protein